MTVVTPIGVKVVESGWPDTDLLYQFLSTNGDGTGTASAIGDYSSVEAQFYIAPPAGTTYHIARMIVCLEDGQGFRAERYAALAAALPNGIEVQMRTGATTVSIDLTAGVPVKTNAHWARCCYDTDIKTWGAGDELLTARWTFSRADGSLRLNGDDSERLTVILNDDFTGVVSQFFMVQGYVV